MEIESFREVIDELCVGFQPESAYWVNITYIINPHDFHVRPCKYDAHLERIESYIKDCNESIQQPTPRQFVVFQSTSNDLKMVRGMICSVEETELSRSCNIFAIDYGYFDKRIPMNQIYKCSDEIFQVPPMAIRCYLHMTAPVGPEWTRESTDAFKYYLGRERVKIIIKHKLSTKLVVILINTCPDDMATMLAMTGYGTLGYVDPYVSKSSTSSRNPTATIRLFYEFKERQVNETLNVRMLYGPNLSGFYVAEVGEYKEYLDMQLDVNLFATRERELRLDEMITGRPALMYEEKHLRSSQRAIIEEVSSCCTEATLLYVDNGKRSVIKKRNIKPITQDLLIPPPLAIYCSAKELSSEIKSDDFFLPGFEFKITINELGSELKLPNIVTISAI